MITHDGKTTHDIHRGDIYYYSLTGKEVGCEMSGTGDRRPCVIVSNNKANAFTSLVTVVPMTSKEKSPVPTRVEYKGQHVHGTFLCEQVVTISKERILNFCGEVDDETMTKIDSALCIQLSLSASESITAPAQFQVSDFRVLQRERDFYKRSYYELIDRIAGRQV